MVQFIKDLLYDYDLSNVSDAIIMAMGIIGLLLVVLSSLAAICSFFLFLSYIKYNKKENSFCLTGEQIARKNLDKNGLRHIKVSKTGSVMFGNSYSHYFNKIRLRRLTWQKTSITSMAMAYQKSELAVLDKEGDPDMKKRIKLTPVIYFGPIAFVPMVIIGLLLDLLLIHTGGLFTIILTLLGLISYIASFVMSLLVLKTEVKAQQRALESMTMDGASMTEVMACKKLFKLYNIEYVNDMIIALLELIYRILQIALMFSSHSSTSSNND